VTSKQEKITTPTNEKPEGYEDLLVWQKGMALVKMVYLITRAFPRDERFGLVSQMRRAAISVPSNIAEGQARHTTGEFVQFISIAEGSVAELNTQLLLSVELGFCTSDLIRESMELAQELRRMLIALRRKLQGR
jgi:four helix bundle protein